jgi:hypothetical protein
MPTIWAPSRQRGGSHEVQWGAILPLQPDFDPFFQAKGRFQAVFM